MEKKHNLKVGEALVVLTGCVNKVGKPALVTAHSPQKVLAKDWDSNFCQGVYTQRSDVTHTTKITAKTVVITRPYGPTCLTLAGVEGQGGPPSHHTKTLSRLTLFSRILTINK